MTTAENFDDRFRKGENGVLLEAMNQATAITSVDEAIEPRADVLQAEHCAGRRVVFEFNDGSFFAITTTSSIHVEVGHFEYDIKCVTPMSAFYGGKVTEQSAAQSV
jgi:hypothetical protein